MNSNQTFLFFPLHPYAYLPNGLRIHTALGYDYGDLNYYDSSKTPDMVVRDMPESQNNSYPIDILNNIRISNANRIIIGQLNTNSLRNKFHTLKTKIDILVITESYLGDTFPENQFLIDGFSSPYRLDRDSNGGGVIIFVREDLPCRVLKSHNKPDNFDGIVLEK